MAARAMLGLEPDVPAGTLGLNPCLPAGSRVTMDGLVLGDHTVSFAAEGSKVLDAVALSLRLTIGRR